MLSFRMETTRIMIQGERLEGNNKVPNEKWLKLVTRGLAHPLQETLTKWGWTSDPVVSIVLTMDQERKRIKGSNYVVHGTVYDSVIKADKVSVINLLKHKKFLLLP